MPDHQEEHLKLIGIVRRWCKREGGSLILFFPEVAASTTNPYYIDSYAQDGHASADYNMLVHNRITLPVDYDDLEVTEFVTAYERAHNCTIVLRKRNFYRPTINV